MTELAATPQVAQTQSERPRREVIHRHALVVRLSHWINALAIFLLLGSGLNIFNAHPRLYWGRTGTWGDPAWLSIGVAGGEQAPRGDVQVGPLHVASTGWLGWFPAQHLARGWPTWITVPSFQDLADARHWHFFFAWILVANGLVYLGWSLISGHLTRDLAPTRANLRDIPRDVWDHLRLRLPRGEEAKHYNVLQKLAYLGVIVLICGMVLTGLTMSPGMDAFAPWLLDLLGGRQSARSIHFLCANLIAAFILVHLTMVVLAGPINEVRSMITGRYAVPPERG